MQIGNVEMPMPKWEANILNQIKFYFMAKTKRLSIEELKAKAEVSQISQNLESILGGKLGQASCHLIASGGTLIDECTGHAVVYNPDGSW